MAKKEYKVIPYNNRFAIADLNGKIIDNAKGAGYITANKAHRAAWWILKNNLHISTESKIKYHLWLTQDDNMKIAAYYDDLVERYYNDLSRGILTLDEIFTDVEEKYNITLPDYVKDNI